MEYCSTKDRTAQLIRLLADGQYHSGTVLARSLGMTRAGVWKAMQGIRSRFGLEIHSHKRWGYRLSHPLELLDEEKIRSHLPADARRHLAQLEIFQELDSTNAYLLRQGRIDAPRGRVCLAEYQRAGRGRRGRSWASPFGSNLYLSLLWRYALAPQELGALSLALGASIAQVLENFGVQEIALKWPNDLLWHKRKLGGILIEMVAESQGPCLVVVGLGINTRLSPAAAASIQQPWTDLESILGTGACSRNALAAALIGALLQTMTTYEIRGFPAFLPAWQRYDRYLGEAVELHQGTKVLRGIYRGITDTGALRLEGKGGMQCFQGGEVSLRTRSS